MTTTQQSDAQEPRDRSGAGLPVPPAVTREPLPLPTGGGETVAEKEQPVAPTGPVGPGDTESRASFAEFTHRYIREYIHLADQKATFFFTGATALLAFLYKSGVSNRWLRPIIQWNILDTVAFISMIALAAGAFLTLMVVIPRTPGSRRGFIFWEAVAEYDSGRQYADELLTLSPATLFQIKTEHCFDLARVCRRKYKVLRIGIWVCAVGVAASLLVFLFS